MGKASGQNMASQVTKQSLHGIKNGSMKKDKKPKFKNTPTGKVALIDNMKGQNKNMNPQKKFQKNTSVKNNQDSPKEKLKQLEEKENSPKGKQNSPKGKQNIPKQKQTTNKSQKNQSNKKTNFTPKKELEVDDSDSDINEGIIPQEEISMMDEASENEEGSDIDVPDIFGASLAEDSDVDDEDFEDEEEEQENEQKDEEEEDEESEEEEEDNDDDDDDDDDSDVSNEEEMVEHKNIQMFKGVKSNAKNQSLEVSEDDDDDDDDEEDEDDDDDDEDEDIDMDTSVLENEDEDDDEDEDEDDDEEDDEEEEEDEKAALGLKALLGKSMVDDDDDEDFNEEDEDDEDDDISDEEEDEEDDNVVKGVQGKATKTSNSKDASKKDKQIKGKPLSPEEQEEIDKRTIFVDNIPKETKAAALKKVFGQYGSINNLRFRNIMPKNSNISKKVAAITQDIHPKAVSVVVYINYKSEESAKKALCMNGKKFEGNYLNVRIISKSAEPKYDYKKAIFIGNLKFGINANLIWELFSKCGDIESVRLLRDKSTGQTKGFGYVNFKSEDAVALALKLDDTVVNNRPIRVRLCRNASEKSQSPRNQGKGEKRFFSNKSNDNRPSKKFKKNSQKAIARPTEDEGKVKQNKPQRNNESPEEKVSKSFQGQKADVKNKKGSKFDKKKKEMAGKLTAKPKKQKA